MGSRAVRSYNAIMELPFPPLLKFKLIQLIRQGACKVRATKSGEKQDVCLVMSNEGYGHEYWLKRYSGFPRDIHAQIEHGVYFGGNTSPEVNIIRREYEIGAFITYGEYRERHLRCAYPANPVLSIGPYIQYAETDSEYLDEINSHVTPENKTVTLFPSHSVKDGRVQFEHKELIRSVKDIASSHDYENLLVCLSPMDYSTSLADLYKREGFVIVTSGSDSIRFLPRQRAIYQASDLTLSNDLGTHIGYSLALNVPHAIINPLSIDEKIKANCIAPGIDLDLYKKERDEILDTFSFQHFDKCHELDQNELFNYYWGGNIKLSPSELKKKLDKLY